MRTSDLILLFICFYICHRFLLSGALQARTLELVVTFNRQSIILHTP